MIDRIAFSDPKLLAVAMNNNYRDFFETLGVCDNIKVKTSPSILTVSSDIPFPLFNCVLSTTNDEHIATVEISNLKSQSSINSTPVMWSISNDLQSSKLKLLLEKESFVMSENAPGMALDLKTINKSNSNIDGLTITKVTNTGDLRVWCETMVEGYGLPSFVGDALYEFNLDLWENNIYTVDNYIGYFNGQPVATSTVFFSAGVAGLYNVSTIASARNKGIGTAITLAPLNDAIEMEYQVATLFSSELGLGVYQSIGFEQFSAMSQYVYSASTTSSKSNVAKNQKAA
jgi:hypothetical protein